MKNNDGRAKNGGHSTKGFAGRKPKEQEIKLIEMMDNVADSSEIWIKLHELAKKGNVRAIEAWLSYRYGKPKQTIDQNNTHDFSGLDGKTLSDLLDFEGEETE